MNITGRPIYQKGQTAQKKAAKPMRKKAPEKTYAKDGGPYINQTLRDFAKGKECQMRGPYCNGDPETVVLCHDRRDAGAGMAQKPHDFWAYHGCSACHAHEAEATDADLKNAVRRTQYAVLDHFGTLTPE